MPSQTAVVRFIVLTSPRSGSTWFIDTLNNAPGVAAYGELFQPGRVRAFRWGEPGFPPYVVYRRERTGGVTAYLRDLFERHPAAAAVGFKLMYRHALQHPPALAYLRRRGVRVLHLVRANSVDVALSRAFIAARPYGHATESELAQTLHLHVDTAALLADVRAHQRTIRAARTLLQLAGAPRLEVTYERLCEEPVEEVGRVARFLQLDEPPDVRASPLRKLSSGQGAGVTNAEEVRRALVGAGYEDMLRGSW